MNTATVALREGNPEALALRFEQQSFSFAQLWDRIRMAGGALRSAGIDRGTTFAVLCENCPEVLIAYYAAAELGAVFIPINPSLKPAEISYVFQHSDALLLFHDAAMAQVAAAAVPAEQRRSIALLAQSEPDPSADPAHHVDGDFLIIYTSGSTGVPKGVVFNQAAETAGNAALIGMWEITPNDRMVVALPLGFLYGLSTAAGTALQAGCEVILLRRFHPARVLEALVSHRATLFQGVPTMFAMMLDYAEQNDLNIDLSFMRLLICAGAPLPTTLRERFRARFGKAIDDYYALTEVRPIFGRSAADAAPIPVGAIGKAAPGATIRIVDTEGRDVGGGEQGELLVRAAATLTRYHKNPTLTENALRDGLFATGDLGFRDPEGHYFLTGRIKDVIIRGGANIAPAEVEEVLLGHQSIRAAAVVGHPDATFGEVPVAFIVTKGQIDLASVIDHCRGRLADFKVPNDIFILAELPVGITGKVDKNALRSRLEKSV